MFYGAMVAAVFIANQYVSNILLDIRSKFKHIPVTVAWPLYMVINVLRVSLIFPYYIIPLGSFVIWYFMVTLGVETASLVLIWTWVLQVLMYVPVTR